MKSVFRLIGIVSMALIIGFSMAACGDDGGGGESDPLNGTWYSGSDQLRLNNGSFEVTDSGTSMAKGNYITSASSITLNIPILGSCFG
jgi:hypothetical protein